MSRRPKAPRSLSPEVVDDEEKTTRKWGGGPIIMMHHHICIVFSSVMAALLLTQKSGMNTDRHLQYHCREVAPQFKKLFKTEDIIIHQKPKRQRQCLAKIPPFTLIGNNSLER